MAGGKAFWNKTATTDGGTIDTTPSSIDDLTDVDTLTATPTIGQTIVWDGTNWVPGTIDVDVQNAGRWEVVVAGVPAEAVTTPDGTDWVHAWVADSAPEAAPSLASTSAIALGDTSAYAGNPIVEDDTGAWDASIREPGGVLFDPTTDQYVVAYTGINGTDMYVGLSFSADGLTGWTPAASNPVTPGVRAEDPYIAKNIDGTVYRDPDGRALMFCEEKNTSSPTHRGIILFRSSADTLDGWTLYGRVLDKAAAGWDSQDRTSPVVIHDGTQLVMLYEGRGPGQEGRVGYATGTADGLTWTAAANPIVVQGAAGTWNDQSVVPDDVIKIGTSWVLIMHAYDAANFHLGRYATTDEPAGWDASSFTEMAGNPYDSTTDAAMCWRNHAARLVRMDAVSDSTRYDIVDVVDA